MKKRNFFTMLTASLVVGLSLTSCAPAKVSEEEGKAALAKIQNAYKANEVETPNKFTVTTTLQASQATSGNGQSISETLLTEALVAVDFENHQAYSKALLDTGKEEHIMETWLYYEDGSFITALSDGKNHAYSKLTVSLPEVEELFNTNTDVIGTAIDMIGENAIETAEELIEQSKSLTYEAMSKEYGVDIKFDGNIEYRSNGDGSFMFVSKADATGGIDKTTHANATIHTHNEIEIKDYILKGLSSTTEVTLVSEALTQATTIDASMDVALKARIKLPDLSKFQLQGE